MIEEKMEPFKKRARFLCLDDVNLQADGDDDGDGGTSNLIEAEVEISKTISSPNYDKQDALTMRQSGSGEIMEHEGDGDSGGGDEKQVADETKHVIEHDSTGGNDGKQLVNETKDEEGTEHGGVTFGDETKLVVIEHGGNGKDKLGDERAVVASDGNGVTIIVAVADKEVIENEDQLAEVEDVAEGRNSDAKQRPDETKVAIEHGGGGNDKGKGDVASGDSDGNGGTLIVAVGDKEVIDNEGLAEQKQVEDVINDDVSPKQQDGHDYALDDGKQVQIFSSHYPAIVEFNDIAGCKQVVDAIEEDGGRIERAPAEGGRNAAEDREQVPPDDLIIQHQVPAYGAVAPTDIEQDPMSDSRKRKSHELGDLSLDGDSGDVVPTPEEAASKKTKLGRDEIGGSSSITPPCGFSSSAQQANPTFPLFGIGMIPCEEERELQVIHQPATRVFRLFGANISVPLEPAAAGSSGNGSSTLTNQESGGQVQNGFN